MLSHFGPLFALSRCSAAATTTALARTFSSATSTGKDCREPSATSSSSSSSMAPPGGDFKAVDLSYAAFECKPKEGEKVKDPLVILHSLLGRKKNWKTVAKEINHLTRRKVVSVDARNHGDSPHTMDMSYSLMAKDVTQLLKQLKMDKINFLGHSMGGRVGMILAMTQPQLINKLVCVDATPVNSPVSLDRWKILGEAILILKEMEPELRRVQGVTRTILADKAVKHVLPDHHDRSLFLSNLLVTKDKNNGGSFPPDSLWRLNVEAIVANPLMSAGFPHFSTFPQFDGKVLFVAGEHSRFFKPEHENEIRQLFPNARIVTIPDCGHWVHSEKHKTFMEVVVPFLEG